MTYEVVVVVDEYWVIAIRSGSGCGRSGKVVCVCYDETAAWDYVGYLRKKR